MNDTDQASTSRDLSQLFRLLVAVAIVAAIVIVAFDNRDDVRVGYAFGDTQAPIWIVLLAAGVAGVVVGWLIKHRPHRS